MLYKVNWTDFVEKKQRAPGILVKEEKYPNIAFKSLQEPWVGYGALQVGFWRFLSFLSFVLEECFITNTCMNLYLYSWCLHVFWVSLGIFGSCSLQSQSGLSSQPVLWTRTLSRPSSFRIVLCLRMPIQQYAWQ